MSAQRPVPVQAKTALTKSEQIEYLQAQLRVAELNQKQMEANYQAQRTMYLDALAKLQAESDG